MEILLTIGMLAQEAGVSIETIRYYEKKGLIAPPPRNKAGYRIYSPITLERIRFIKVARDMGFSLSETELLLDWRDASDQSERCQSLRDLLNNKLADIERRKNKLQQQYRHLEGVLQKCPDGFSDRCDECLLLTDFTLSL